MKKIESEGYCRGICDNDFSGIEDAKFLQEVSASYRNSKLRMHNFDGKHPRIIENVGCRCKIITKEVSSGSKNMECRCI